MDVEFAREYILHLQKRNRFEDYPYTPVQQQILSRVSVECYVHALKAFFNWLYKEGYIEENKLAIFKTPKVPKKLIEPQFQIKRGIIVGTKHV